MLNFDSPQVARLLPALKNIDFELAYLAVLTRQGIKPLSRWEKPLSQDSVALLESLDLLTKQIKRTVKNGTEPIETIFSKAAGYLELYEKRFADKPIDKSAATLRFEGFLFGYPSCCVDEFIRHPYAKNGLAPQQQKILFHWACKDCNITPILLPGYQSIHDFLSNEIE